MALEWTHDEKSCHWNTQVGETKSLCIGTTDCPEFPTNVDRIDMAEAAYKEYAEADDTAFEDFIQDVLMLAFRRKGMGFEEVVRLAVNAKD